MLAIYLKWLTETRRLEYDLEEIRIGSAHDNTIALTEGGLASYHCKLLVRAVGCFVIDLSGGETRVNGRALTAPRALYREDLVDIGEYTFLVEHLARDRDPIEERLLAEIQQRDESSRAVYADWLEENGDVRRAELLRVEEILVRMPGDDPAFHDHTRRLRQLAAVIDLDWRIKIARPRVEACALEDCAMDWGSLVEIDRPDVRICPECTAPVQYCESVLVGRLRAQRGERVAIDATNVRMPDDLEPT